jgi:F-type H+-transporting ATPase subunit delta
MQNEKVARRYALAVFGLAKERGAIEAVGNDLHAALDAIVGVDDASRFFLSPVIDRGEKERILAASFASLDELALHTVLLLVRKRREALLRPIVAQYDLLALEHAGRERLKITSAKTLEPAELDGIVSRLASLYGKTFEVEQRVDPSLLAGVRIDLGDQSVDGSIAGRLDELARDLNTPRRNALA